MNLPWIAHADGIVPSPDGGNVMAKKLDHQQQFEAACDDFTASMDRVSKWKASYFGAAYSTRLRSAINEARVACGRLEEALREENG